MNSGVGVLIVTYNRVDLLRECIQHVLNQTILPDRIVIVDNASNDETPAYLSKLQIEKLAVSVVSMCENVGGAGGFKRGLENLINDESLKWYLLIDDDAMIDKSYISNIIAFAEMHPDIEAITGVVYQNGIIDYDQRRILTGKVIYKPQRMDESEYKRAFFDYDLASFCGLMISSNLVHLIGLPLEKYFIWCDDTEYSLRIKKVTRIININCATLNHKTSGIDYDAVRTHWKMYYSFRNRLDLIHRHYSLFAVFCEFMRIVHIALQNCCYLFNKNTRNDGIHNIILCFDSIHDFLFDKFGKNDKYT